MLVRRFCLVSVLLLLSNSGFLNAASTADTIRWVKPLTGTGGHGHTYPGATVPFGMVQVGPDTYNKGWDWSSGYHYSDSSIIGFSHTHLSGTGVGDMLDVLIMPITGELRIEPGSREKPGSGYRSQFSHQQEVAQPGYYSALLTDYDVKVEITATQHAGFHKYTFPKNENSHVLIDLAHMYLAEGARIVDAQLKIENESLVTGYRRVFCWAPDRHIYFAARFSKPSLSSGLVIAGARNEKLKEAKGTNLKCYLSFRTHANEVVLVKVGLSGVSVEGALKNLDTEISDWNFENTRRQAREAWDQELSKIKIQTDSERDREVFYTALYHTMLAPTLFDDVDGQYRGMDGRVHRASGFHNYSTFSLWDTYRAAHPLYNLIEKERVSDMVNCLIAMTGESSQKNVPVWPLAGNETWCMIGYHAVDVIAEAFLKGIAGFDSEEAYQLMKRQALMQDYRGLGDYQKLGYVPCNKEAESASKTIEYSYDDWAIAQMARKLGKNADYQFFLKRAGSYRNLFDAPTGFIRPRREDGQWAVPFDPKKTGTSDRWRDFTEANAWQYSWPQQDPGGYIRLLGGKNTFVQKLDQLFSQSPEVEGEVPADMTGLIGMYAHGNEPSHHIAYLYNYAGVPFKTQERVREILEKMYGNTPDGLSGNEDCGQMSAWYVLSALGFYPVDPVSGNYVMGSPLFPQATIELGNGKQLVIRALNTSGTNKYIQSATLNGELYSKTWFSHQDIARGGVLVFQMGSQPNPKYGSNPEDVPPSMSE